MICARPDELQDPSAAAVTEDPGLDDDTDTIDRDDTGGDFHNRLKAASLGCRARCS